MKFADHWRKKVHRCCAFPCVSWAFLVSLAIRYATAVAAWVRKSRKSQFSDRHHKFPTKFRPTAINFRQKTLWSLQNFNLTLNLCKWGFCHRISHFIGRTFSDKKMLRQFSDSDRRKYRSRYGADFILSPKWIGLTYTSDRYN